MDDSPYFPVAPRAFDGGSRTVEAGAGFDWLHHGWAQFAAAPGLWVAGVALMLAVALAPAIVLSIVPWVGLPASHSLLPVFAAGLLYLCRRQSAGETPAIGDLFVGFRQHRGQLLTVGAIYALGVLAIGWLVSFMVRGGVAAGEAMGPVTMFGGLLLAGLFVLVLATPLLMAVWFAPALVFFNTMPPLGAMQASFQACLKNWLPMLVYGVILALLLFVAALPLGLGLLVLIPVLSGAAYASYRDVFIGV